MSIQNCPYDIRSEPVRSTRRYGTGGKQSCVTGRTDVCIVCRTEAFPGTWSIVRFSYRTRIEKVLRTIGNVLARYVRNVLGENDSETPEA
jgi:hypothetical protein